MSGTWEDAASPGKRPLWGSWAAWWTPGAAAPAVQAARAGPRPPAAKFAAPVPAISPARRPCPARGLEASPLLSVVMTVASSGSPQPCLVLADSLKMYADSGASSVAVNCLTVAPTSTVVSVLGLLLARR